MGKLKIFTQVAGAVTKVGGKALLKCKKVSPEILLIGGVTCGVAAVVTAVIATKKAYEDAELAEVEEELEAVEAEIKEERDKNSRKEIRKGAWKLWVKKAKRLAKHYAIPFALALMMVLSMLGGFGILKGRYVATAAAYTALDQSFKDYRQRIRDIAGDEAEQRFFDGTDEIELKTKDENGKTVKTKVNKQKPDVTKTDSPYEFDWNKGTAPERATTDSAHNFTELRAIQMWANDLLHARGYLFLNEVLEELGIHPVPWGQLVGWLAHGDGDGYVDFGISEYYTDAISDILDGNIPNIHLNFNCDGIIYEKI